MKKTRSKKTIFGGIALLAVGAMALTGCETNAQTGALFGATFGALVGSASGHHGSGALIGSAIGGGLGYAIGNEEDKRQQSGYTAYYSPRPKYSTRVHTTRVVTTHEPVCVRKPVVVERRVHVHKPRYAPPAEPVYSHNPLAGTSWKVVSVTGDHARRPRIASAVITFVDHKQMVAVRTRKSGRVDSLIEGYRVVDNVLIVELDGVLMNARFVLDGDRLIPAGSHAPRVSARAPR